jgi:hypothetical protein
MNEWQEMVFAKVSFLVDIFVVKISTTLKTMKKMDSYHDFLVHLNVRLSKNIQ